MTKKENKQPVNQPIVLDPSIIAQAEDWEELLSLWMTAKEADQTIQWFKGDIACKVETKYGKGSLRKFAEEVDESTRTLEHYRRVSRAFPPSKRNWNLSWTHYLIASFTDSYRKQGFISNDRFNWIEKAHDNAWSTARMKEEIKKKQALKDDDDIYGYYDEYLDKVRNVLMHIEKDKMAEHERKKLIHKLLDIYNEVLVYLGEK